MEQLESNDLRLPADRRPRGQFETLQKLHLYLNEKGVRPALGCGSRGSMTMAIGNQQGINHWCSDNEQYQPWLNTNGNQLEYYLVADSWQI